VRKAGQKAEVPNDKRQLRSAILNPRRVYTTQIPDCEAYKLTQFFLRYYDSSKNPAGGVRNSVDGRGGGDHPSSSHIFINSFTLV
jgi:hypothetical protein